ncbi:hypothetical protein [Paramicrobacterium agarici]|uniref:hypothetical protein n=1 Tax=Paramicrobacterium agarici TaxID=630514 RepID=UPI001152A25A|nr:hypothetical protein [Microbacterium agarici]TQO23828.1 hypothetical protein FB385_2690 [Microbacterium agarici]
MSQDTAHARASDPETSHEAAESVTNLTEVQHLIGVILEDEAPHHPLGMSDEQIEAAYRQRFGLKPSSQSLRSRRKELVRKGLVVFTGFHWKPEGRRTRSRRWALAGSEDEA